MKILLIKLSSLGDIVHSYPALNDMARHLPKAELHWLVEENFEDLAKLHPFVKKTHIIQLRRLKKQKAVGQIYRHIREVRQVLRAENYDAIIDAQGLFKSAIFGYKLTDSFFGYDKKSARDGNASFFYPHKIHISKNMHALERTRHLCAQALQYSIENQGFDYGLNKKDYQKTGQDILAKHHIEGKFAFFLHGTTWPTKHWPLAHWLELATLLKAQNIKALVTYGNDAEKQRTEQMKQANDNIYILPQQNLLDVMAVLSCADKFVSVDTGLGHLAAALNLEGVAIYGPTSPEKVGILGQKQTSLWGYKQGEPQYNKNFKKGFDSMANIDAHQVYEILFP